MSEMIGRVTAAIKKEIGRQLGAKPLHGDQRSTDWHAWGSFGPDPDAGTLNLELIARAAMSAMRDPTEQMIREGNAVTTDGRGAEDSWPAMIETALGKTP